MGQDSPPDQTGLVNSSLNFKEYRRIYELKWEVQILGTFLAITRKNSSLQQQLSQIQNDLQSSKSTDQIMTSINQFIDQFNQGIEGAVLPSFEFSNNTNERLVLEHHIVALEKFLNLMMENKLIPFEVESPAFQKTSNLWQLVSTGQLTIQEGSLKLQTLIEEINSKLSDQYVFPSIPIELYGGRV